MNLQPKASIVVITYNQQKSVREAIESVLNQTYQNFEVIVSDDSSTDDTASVVKSFNDSRVKYVKTPYNIGISGNSNFGLTYASGEIIAFIAGDDMLRQNYLACVVENFEKLSEVSVLHCGLCLIDQNGRNINGKNSHFHYIPNVTDEEKFCTAFMCHNILNSPGIAMRKEVAQVVFPLPNSFINIQDYAMHIDILVNGFKSYVLDEILVDYRVVANGTNISLNNQAATRREQVETELLMDRFLQFKDVEFLKRVFKNEIQQTNIKPFVETIPFFLGQMALLSKRIHRREWGYRTIMRFLNDKRNFDIVSEKYGFTFKDYLQLIRQVGESKYYKKYRKYRKISLILSIVLVAMCLGLLACIMFY